MKIHMKKRLLFTFMLIVQIFSVQQILAEDVVIPQQSFKTTRGTVVILPQTIWVRESDKTGHVDLMVTDIPKVFEPECLYLNGYESKGIWLSQSDYFPDSPTTISYLDYLYLCESGGKNLKISAKLNPVTSPNDMVDLLNGFVEGGAQLNGNGEVVLLKDIKAEGFDPTEQKEWIIQTDLALIGNGHKICWGEKRLDLTLKNLCILIDDVIEEYCCLEIVNSTILCKNKNRFHISKVEGNVSFKGVNEEKLPVCSYDLPSLDIALSGYFNNPTISFENVGMNSTGILDSSPAILNIKECNLIGTLNIHKDQYVNIEGCFIPYTIDAGESMPGINVENGYLKIHNSQLLDDIYINGKDAKVEINSGLFQALTIQDGKVTVNNGYFPSGIAMGGGSLEVNGGKIALLNVNDKKCDITLNQGLFRGIKIPSDVNKSIWDMLGHGAGITTVTEHTCHTDLGISRATTKPSAQSY